MVECLAEISGWHSKIAVTFVGVMSSIISACTKGTIATAGCYKGTVNEFELYWSSCFLKDTAMLAGMHHDDLDQENESHGWVLPRNLCLLQ